MADSPTSRFDRFRVTDPDGVQVYVLMDHGDKLAYMFHSASDLQLARMLAVSSPDVLPMVATGSADYYKEFMDPEKCKDAPFTDAQRAAVAANEAEEA